MKRGDLFRLLENLEKVKNLQGVRFNYIVDKNKKLINEEIEDIKKAIVPNKKFTEYEQARLKLLSDFATKDDKGYPKYSQQEKMIKFDIPDEKMKDLQVEMSSLLDANKPIIIERDKQMIEYDKFLQENIEMKFVKMNLPDISNEITGEQFEIISMFVNEE